MSWHYKLGDPLTMNFGFCREIAIESKPYSHFSMPGMDVDEAQFSRQDVLALIDNKDKIEKEISDWKVVLDINNVGMTGPVVDEEGFPRNDMDVSHVRHARQRIICLQNDHKELMKQIEHALHNVHARERETLEVEMAEPTADKTEHTAPIAKVKLVHVASPASAAGLQVEDLIVEFGSVNDSNFSSLKDIGTVVEHSIGVKLAVVVYRQGVRHRLQLIPQKWPGNGLLGCLILPLEDVDR